MKAYLHRIVTLGLLCLVALALVPSVVMAGAEDCLPYNASNLYVVADGDSWLLTDGVSRMKIFDNEADANAGLAVAQQHTAHCFIGRNNTRPNRIRYIIEYWTGESGLGITSADADCLPFDAGSLSYESISEGWIVTDGVQSMVLLDTDVDAQSVINVVGMYGFVEQCFIGRDNSRADRFNYIMTYWKTAGSTGPILQIDPGVILIDPGVIGTIATTDDCIGYNPSTLYVVPDGDSWLLTDGSMRMNIFDTESDALEGLAVAQNHDQQCFIGRGNTRPDRKSFIFAYWQGDSGFGAFVAHSDCISYEPLMLYVVQQGDYWLLTDGVMAMNTLDNATDANAALAVAQQYNAQCFVGRNNTRDNREDFIFAYWDNITVTPPLPPAPVIAAVDCIPYNPASLYVVQTSDYWLLTDGTMAMVTFDNEADANLGLSVAQAHTQQCFIGRNNTRANRSDFIMTYWQ